MTPVAMHLAQRDSHRAPGPGERCTSSVPGRSPPCASDVLALLRLGQPLYVFVSAVRASTREHGRLRRVRAPRWPLGVLRRAFGGRGRAEGMDPQARWPTFC